jgi:hypothetical protein
MASTRNLNTAGDYKLEKIKDKGINDYLHYQGARVNESPGLFKNGPKTMKSRFKQQPLQQLMSMDVNPTEQLRQILNEKNIIKINREYNYDKEYSFDEDEEMENSSSHESFMYAYERLMEKKK